MRMGAGGTWLAQMMLPSYTWISTKFETGWFCINRTFPKPLASFASCITKQASPGEVGRFPEKSPVSVQAWPASPAQKPWPHLHHWGSKHRRLMQVGVLTQPNWDAWSGSEPLICEQLQSKNEYRGMWWQDPLPHKHEDGWTKRLAAVCVSIPKPPGPI